MINRRTFGTVIGAKLSALADPPFAALKTEASKRIVFVGSVAAGRLACKVAPKCSAAREIATLAHAAQEMVR